MDKMEPDEEDAPLVNFFETEFFLPYGKINFDFEIIEKKMNKAGEMEEKGRIIPDMENLQIHFEPRPHLFDEQKKEDDMEE